MGLLRSPAFRAVRVFSAVPLVLMVSLWLAGCADVKLPVDWKVWPEKDTVPRKLPTPGTEAARPAAQKRALQRVVRPPDAYAVPPFEPLGAPLPSAVAGYPSVPSVVGVTGIKIAILLPLSGASANIGAALLDAAQMALFDVGDDRITLLPKDTGGTPETAARAAREAIADGAELILGPVFSQSVAAAAPIAQQSGINMIAFSTDRSVAGRGVFLFGFLPREQIDRVVQYAVDQGLMRFAALVPETAYGNTILDALNQAAMRRGADVVQVEPYPDDGENPHEAVRRLANYEARREALGEERERLKSLEDAQAKSLLEQLEGLETLGELDYDAVIVPEGGDRLRSVALLLPYYDIDPGKIRFIGTGLWDDETIGREPALVGGWFAAVPPNLSKTFADRYAVVYTHRPPRIASIAYDAMALTALIAAEPSYDGRGRFAASKFTDETGFTGANGLFRLRSDGLAERGLAVVEVRRGGTRVIDPPPDTFPPPGVFPVSQMTTLEANPEAFQRRASGTFTPSGATLEANPEAFGGAAPDGAWQMP